MEIFLVRHAESVHNSKRKVQGQVDSELTERGREQAKSLRETLDLDSFDSVYSSKLKRVTQTAEIALNDEDIGVKFDERLTKGMSESLRERITLFGRSSILRTVMNGVLKAARV